MSWQRLVVSGCIFLGAAGCAAEHLVVAAPPDGDAAALFRMQKPETEAAKHASPLDTSPERLVEPGSGRVTASIRAIVGNVPILDDEVRDASLPFLLQIQQLPEPERSSRRVEIFNRVLDQLIEREVILQDCYATLNKGGKKYLEKLKEVSAKEFDRQFKSMKERAAKVTRDGTISDDELKEMLRSQGTSLEGMRRDIERNFIAMQYMRSRVEPATDKIGHEQIVEYYQQHPEDFQILDSVEWQDIFIDARKHPTRQAARQFAEQLAERGRAGEDFAKLATQYDNGDSSYRNGEGSGKRHGEIQPADAEPILFQMKDGQVGPILEQANGYHVIRLVKRTYAGKQPLDEKTQLQIRDKLKDEVGNREYKRLLQQMKRKTTIEYSKAAP